VGRKFADDQAGGLAALITYYGFFSLFPLLLLLRAILGYVLQDREDLQRDILNSALARFPVIGDEIVRSQGELRGSGLALAVGVVGALWAGLGVTQALQSAMDRIWGVPRRARPGLLAGRLRGLLLLLTLGAATLVAAGIGSLTTSSGLVGPGLRAATVVGSLAVNLGLFLVSFRVLTARSVGWAEVLPGAAVAAVGWAALLALGGWLVSHELEGASATYGAFATVIGLLSWMYLSAVIVLSAAEVNVVPARRLWPRALRGPLTPADRRALRMAAGTEALEDRETIDVTFEGERSGE
jgi:membrane protein